ncbi:MAG TPA: glycosyltransferase, partial [Ignavibacteria bacterium]|nr:glycosyltransferase [Ignavibacteria bacterium]
GGYITKNIGCEDWEMWVRIAANFEICYEPEALAQYRIHRTSMTLTDMRTGQDMRFLREAAEIFTEYLPPEKRDKVTLFRNKHYAVYSLNNAKRMYEEFKDEEGAAAQLSETILLDSGLVYKHLDFLRNFKKEIDGAGVSVVICTENDEETIESTLRSLKKQIVPDYIPWEIVIIDNGSNDNTIKLAEESLKILKGKVTYKIFEKSNLNLFDFRKEAIDNSKFNYIIFCNPGDFLNKDYVRKASENMMKEHDTGILGGYSEYESQIIPPDWFNKNTFKYYHIGEQYDVPGEITWSRGYVWGSGMVLRREAWKSLIKKYFKPVFPEGPGKTYNSLFDKKLCFAIRTNKWRIRYSVDLTLNRFINREEFSWKYLRKLQRQNGVNSVILSRYPEFESKKEVDFKNLPGIKNRRKYVKEAIRKLKSYDFRKLCSFENIHENDPEIPDIEFQMGKLSELLKELNSYNKKIRILKRYSRKRDFQFLKFCFPDPYFRFPQYHKLNDRRGLTILFDFENTSYDLLFRSLDKIAAQQLPEKFPWEVIISYKKIDPEIIEKIKIFWKRVKCTADLTFCKAIEINPGNNPALSENSIRRSKFDHLLLLNEKNFINIDFVRIAYKVIRANKRSGVVFGKTEYGSDVKPPKWFGNFKSYYGIGNEPGYSGIVKRDNAFFNRTGFVINKKILTEIDLNKIQELSDLKSIISEKVFEIIYEPRLIVNKYIPVKELSWEYARGLNKKIGAGFTGTDIQIRNFPKTEKLSEAENITVTQSWIYKANKTFGKIRKHPIKKIFSEKNEFVNDTEILEIERLKGEFRKIISSKGRNGISTDTFELSSNGNGSAVSKKKLSGVSIVICCYNSAKVLPLTLEYLIKQKNTENIPWEIIVVNNASTDGTALIAEKLWLRSNSLTPLRIVKENQPGLSAARQLGINTAEYEYVVFCDDDNRLEENFVRNAFEIMNSDESIGVLGGFGDSEYETLPKPWFKDWMDSFAIGKQSENAGDITWSRGFVWGAAMVIRKEAWNKLKAGGFRSILTDRVGNTLSAGGDTEICYALRNNGWKIWYDPSLKFTHYITEERLNWNYLRNLFRGFGNASSGLDVYLKKIPGKVRKEKRIVIPKSVRQELHKALKTLRKTRYKKLLSFKRRREGDTDIPLIEYTIGRIYSLINTRGSYNSGLKLLKKVVRKKDLKYISSDFRNKNPDFPKYRTQKKLNGVSVIVCTYNGADRLAETIRHIANQKVDKNILWEVILVDNASTDNSKEVTKAEWDKHKCSAKLIIVDQPVPGKQLALEKGYEVAKYEYWITCDDDNWLDEN